ncbi:hypothetical protein ES703_84447 [subsurface metagenome]
MMTQSMIEKSEGGGDKRAKASSRRGSKEMNFIFAWEYRRMPTRNQSDLEVTVTPNQTLSGKAKYRALFGFLVRI